MKKYINILSIIILLICTIFVMSNTIVYKEKNDVGALWDNWSIDSLRYFFQATGVDSLSSRMFSEIPGYDGLITVYLQVDTLGESHDTVLVNNGISTRYLYPATFDTGGIVVKFRHYLDERIGWKEHQLRWYLYSDRSTYVDTVKYANVGNLYVTTFRPDSLNSWFSDSPTSFGFEIHNALDDDSTQSWQILLEFDTHIPNR